MSLRRQPGTALVTAMLVVAIASIAATGLIERQHIDIRRTDNLLGLDQAYTHARSAESWAVAVLLRDNRTFDSRQDDWAKLFEPIPVEGGSLSAQVFDETALFNLNNLVDDSGKPSKKDIDAFERLLAQLELDTTLAGAVVDWLDADINLATQGAEDGDYLRLDPPYRAANRGMAGISELRQVRGIDDTIYRKLAAYVTALPRRTAINVNTAPLPVLMAVIKGLDATTAGTIVENRGNKPYEDIAVFRGQQALEGLEVGEVAVGSEYFRIETRVRLGRSYIIQNTLVHRAGADAATGTNATANVGIEVLARARGEMS